jgi:hypothetical protein
MNLKVYEKEFVLLHPDIVITLIHFENQKCVSCSEGRLTDQQKKEFPQT